MTRPDHPRPEVAALATGLCRGGHPLDPRSMFPCEFHVRRAEETIGVLHAAGWTLARSSEREALVAALAGTAGHANVGGLPCWCSKWAEHPMDASRHEDYCQMARAAIEGRP